MPPRRIIQFALTVLSGAALGLAGYTFVYARGYSYLSNNPAACANCHVMNEYYSGWIKGPHRNAATCNDCHTPHDFVGKYTTKAANGFAHSFAFTFGGFPDSIEIKQRSRRVTEGACRTCHAAIVAEIEGPHPGELSCIRCHADAGHM
jgi:cytochrome c nitrite reductase small subunit